MSACTRLFRRSHWHNHRVSRVLCDHLDWCSVGWEVERAGCQYCGNRTRARMQAFMYAKFMEKEENADCQWNLELARVVVSHLPILLR